MRCLRTKMRSTSGASMVIALLFLLLSLVLGGIILSAASANQGRLMDIRTQQQDYLTLSSAAKLMQSAMKGLTFSGGEQTISDSGTGTTSKNYLAPTISSANVASQLVQGIAQQVLQSQPVLGCTAGAMPNDVQLTLEAPGFDDVTAMLSIDSRYNLTVVLSLSDNSSRSYPLTLTVPATVEDNTATTVTAYERSYTSTEDVDGTPTEVTYTVTYHITTTTRTVTVSWDEGIITKEAI